MRKQDRVRWPSYMTRWEDVRCPTRQSIHVLMYSNAEACDFQRGSRPMVLDTQHRFVLSSSDLFDQICRLDKDSRDTTSWSGFSRSVLSASAV